MPQSSSPLVLDTHVWLDVASGRGRFAPRVAQKLERAAEEGLLFVAAITPWEVAMLARAGKLRLSGPVLDWLTLTLQVTKTSVASLSPAIAVDAVELPAWGHADPADRLIVATARHLGAHLVTRDTAILGYAAEVRAVWVLEPN